MGNIFPSIKKHYKNKTLPSAIFRTISMPFVFVPRNPYNTQKSYSNIHLSRGPEYDLAFANKPGRKIIWEIEQKILNETVCKENRFNFHLDFAGGTGRIANFLEPYTDRQVLLDVSSTMLSVAAKKLKKATLVNRDFRDGIPEIDNGQVDLATAFRFFPNAEQDLRCEAMRFLSQKMKRGALLICNNHRNFWSIPFISRRLTFQGGDFGMTNKQLMSIAIKHGFNLVSYYSFGLLPQTEERAILPWRIVREIELFLFRLASMKHRFGYNVLYFFSKS